MVASIRSGSHHSTQSLRVSDWFRLSVNDGYININLCLGADNTICSECLGRD